MAGYKNLLLKCRETSLARIKAEMALRKAREDLSGCKSDVNYATFRRALRTRRICLQALFGALERAAENNKAVDQVESRGGNIRSHRDNVYAALKEEERRGRRGRRIPT